MWEWISVWLEFCSKRKSLLCETFCDTSKKKKKINYFHLSSVCNKQYFFWLCVDLWVTLLLVMDAHWKVKKWKRVTCCMDWTIIFVLNCNLHYLFYLCISHFSVEGLGVYAVTITYISWAQAFTNWWQHFIFHVCQSVLNKN